MTTPSSPTSEFLPPQLPLQEPHWDVLVPHPQDSSAELEPIAPLRTNPATIYERYHVESSKNMARIEEALPEFARVSVGVGSRYGDTLRICNGRSAGKRMTYIGRLSSDDTAVIEGATQCVYRNAWRPLTINIKDAAGAGLGAGVMVAAGTMIGALIQNGQKIIDATMQGHFYDKYAAEMDYANIGALIGAAPGAIAVGIVGFRAVAQTVNRARANTKALVADLHDIATRAERQFVALDDQPHMLRVGENDSMEMRVGTYVQDFLKGLSPRAVEYVWSNGLFTVLQDIAANQAALNDFTKKTSSFKTKDAAAQDVAAKMKEEYTTELDNTLRTLVAFREEILPEAVRLSLNGDEQQELR